MVEKCKTNRNDDNSQALLLFKNGDRYFRISMEYITMGYVGGKNQRAP